MKNSSSIFLGWGCTWYCLHSWSTEEPANPVQGYPPTTKAGLHSGSPSTGFSPSFPGLTSIARSHSYTFANHSNGGSTFAVNPHHPDAGHHASYWMFYWCFALRYQALQDKLPLNNLILMPLSNAFRCNYFEHVLQKTRFWLPFQTGSS